MALTGDLWAVDAVVRREPRDRLTRLLSFRRIHRVARRARAETSQNRLALGFLAHSRAWDVRYAVAVNPATRARTLCYLQSSFGWTVDEALAQRDDLPPQLYGRLWSHPAVKLKLAANPATPAEEVCRLVESPDRFVSGMALTHPRAPADLVDSAKNSPSTPAWVLRRMARDPQLSEAERDRLLVWLTLGGAAGDPNFDPISCVGTPGPRTQTYDDAYREECAAAGLGSALWRARVMVGRGARRLDLGLLGAMARDPHPQVRHVAAGYRAIGSLKELQFDAIPQVSVHAENTLRSTPQPKWKSAIDPEWWIRIAVVVAIAVVALLAVAPHDDAADADGDQFVSHLAQWADLVGRPSFAKLCEWGGGSVWVESTPVFTLLYVSADHGDVEATAQLLVQGVPSGGPLSDHVSDGSVSRLQLLLAAPDGLALVHLQRSDDLSLTTATVEVPFGMDASASQDGGDC
jgi:hypothetical protein